MLKFTWKFIRPFNKSVLLLIVLSGMKTLLGIVLPLVSAMFINGLIAGNSQIILQTVLLLLLTNGILFLCNYCYSLLQIKVQVSSSTKFIEYATASYLEMPYSLLEKNEPAVICTNINNDCNSILIYCLNLIVSFPSQLLSFVITSAILIGISRFLFFGALISMIIVLYLYKKFGNRLEKAQKDYIESQTDYFRSYLNWMTPWRTWKFNPDRKIRMLISEKKDGLITAGKKQIKTDYVFTLAVEVLQILPQILLLVFGGYQVIKGSLSIGIFIALNSYLSQMQESVSSISGTVSEWKKRKANYDRVQKYMTAGNFKENLKDRDQNPEKIRLKIPAFSFEYDSGKKIEFPEMSFEPGHLYVVEGGNAAGKSTLLRLLGGLYSDDSSIQLSTQPILNFPREEIGFFWQNEEYIKPLSVLDNINIGDKGLYYANEIANFIELDENYINKDNSGDSLTGGQRQKIRLLQALNQNKKAYLLDEPTNHLDERAKNWLIQNLKEKKKHSIVIVASHDSAVQKAADVIIQLE